MTDKEYLFGVEPDIEMKDRSSGSDIAFNIIACDFSFRRPGFAVLFYDGTTRSVKL